MEIKLVSRILLFLGLCENSIGFVITRENACDSRSAHVRQGPHTTDGNGAEKAVDGNISQSSNYASVQNRTENGTAWWSIDLGYRRTIVNLTVLWADDTGPNNARTIKRRYGYEIYVSNTQDPLPKDGILCYQDMGTSDPAPAIVSRTTCKTPSRYIHLYNTRPSNISNASDWPNLEITEVIAIIEKGETSCTQGKFGWNCQLTCHCAATDQCDTTNGDCPNGCDELWAGPKCQIKLENVSEKKTATQDSTKDDRDADYAVDGIIDQKMNYSHAVNRNENSTVWWQVDLGVMEKIHVINVYFAEPVDDPSGKKLQGASLKVFNSTEQDAPGITCYQDTSSPDDKAPSIVNLKNCSWGSVIRLYNSRNSSLNGTVYSKFPQLLISEVQVLADKGCAAGTYGTDCEKICGHCKDVSCRREDGSCEHCSAGWYGNGCQEECAFSCPNSNCEKGTGYCKEPCTIGHYGNWCNETCSKNCLLGGCERTTGKCNSCAVYNHGEFCENVCSSNCKTADCPNRICDRDNGHCLCGCKDKTFGNTCDRNCPTNCIQCNDFETCLSCEPDHWGKKCERPCAVDCLNKHCDKVSGKCHRCDGYKYGNMCETECPMNCVGRKCYQNGTCQQGCEDQGYYGDRCDILCSRNIPNCVECQQTVTGDIDCTSCVNRRHGSKCESSCPGKCISCVNDTLCTQCEIGSTGELCDTSCSVQDCLECNINGTCRRCRSGRYGHNCESVCPDCETCEKDGSLTQGYRCLTCPIGKYLLGTRGLCFNCSANCDGCAYTANNCSLCKHGYYGARCDRDCPDSCQSCLSDTICTSCKIGWTGSSCLCNIKHCITDPDESKWCADNGTCHKGCIKGFYGSKCEFECHKNCIWCEQHGAKCLECTPGLYGIDCGKSCSVNCAEKDSSGTSVCGLQDGSCNFCVSGWYGSNCSTPCNPNCLNAGGSHGCYQKDGTCDSCKEDKYGPSCELDCSPNCVDRYDVNSCNKSNGSCKSCKDGFYDVYCNKTCSTNCKTSCEQGSGDCDECESGFYGQHCEKPCPSNCGRGQHSNMIVCNRFTGECLFCREGFHGEICNLPCSEFCSVGKHKPVCKKAMGHCLSCQPGQYGAFCDGNCSENCGIADDNDAKIGLCNRDTSHCLHGCANGWFNHTCEDRCNSKCRGEVCNVDDGKCTNGCVSGYIGDYCNALAQTDASATAGIIGGVIAALVVVAVVIIIFILVRRKYFRRQVRKGSNTRVHKRAAKNGITADEIIPLYANVNGSNSLPLPARNTTKATVEEEVLNDGDDTTPLMGSDRKASDYYNLSSLIPVAGFADYVHGRQAANVHWYKDDFAKLPRGLLKNCLVAVSPANRGKCRYKNLYPYDDTRVMLEPDGSEKGDFINASYIHGYQKKEAFIAAQGPTEQNVNDFWRMIWQKDCGKIVMLTNLYEDCKIKCVKYWPSEKETETYGNLEVQIAGEEVFSDYILRHLKVLHKPTREEKDFDHFHFTAWPDRGVPENAGALLHFRDKVNEAEGVPDGPILVHCSAGIGRTGTFIVIDYLIRQAKSESHLDVFRTVTDMRYQRANFVQTDIQYEFIHKALVEALTTKEMEIAAADFCRYYWSLLEDKCEYSNQTKLQEQYETLNEMSATLDDSCFTSGRLPENIGKNRYPDIIPVDTYRAYLSTPVSGSNEYINAVFVPTCMNKTAFLITQMPLPHTVTDFWRLVYDQHVSTIVMMNNVPDDNDETVGEYWPSEDSTYGPFKVELLSCENHDHYSIMAMKLTYTSSSRQDSMTVRQYRFESWPDGELLPLSTKALVTLTEAVNQSPKTYKDESVIVHCMNGNDRSGLFCTVSAILSQLKTQEKVNIPQTILQLRRHRPQLIPNLEQYDFCHRAVSEHLDDKQIYSNVM